MSDIEHIPSSAIEVLSPLEQAMIRNIIRQATMEAALSPWQQRQIQFRVSRERSRLIVQLARVEGQAVLGTAVIVTEGRLAVASERQATRLLEEQLRDSVKAGHAYDDTVADTRRLTDASREAVQGTAAGIFNRYLRGLEMRAEKAAHGA